MSKIVGVDLGTPNSLVATEDSSIPLADLLLDRALAVLLRKRG
jgi:molecular chaperone DnaK (HSP70)